MAEGHIRGVVAGVDGSPDSLAALEVAAKEAEARNLPLQIVYGYVDPMSYAPYASPMMSEMGTAAAQEVVTAAAAQVGQTHPNLAVHPRVVPGGGPAVLIAESEHAELVVVGCRGRGGFAGLLVGSVSTQVAAHAACPVLVVRPQGAVAQHDANGRIVVGVDASQGCMPAVEFAFAQAARRQVPLTAIHVWSHLPVTELTADVPIAYSYAQAHEDALRVIAESLAGWSEKFPDVEVHRVPILAENAGKELVNLSEHSGLIVVGSRGRGHLASALLGSVGHTLIHHAHCPVAIAR